MRSTELVAGSMPSVTEVTDPRTFAPIGTTPSGDHFLQLVDACEASAKAITGLPVILRMPVSDGNASGDEEQLRVADMVSAQLQQTLATGGGTR